MKAYIATKQVNSVPEWVADLVSEQDYHCGGPHARSFRSGPHADIETAKQMAREFAEDHSYTIASVDEVAA